MVAVSINWWAILACIVASMIVGTIWYSPALLGKEWQKLVKLKDEDMKASRNQAMIIAVVASGLTAYVLRHFIVYAGDTTIMGGVVTAFWVWVGFLVTQFVMLTAFEGRSWKLTWINLSNQLVTLVAMGIILTWIQ